MNTRTAYILILLGAVATFASGLYGIYYRSPTRLSNEISIYIQTSLFTLSPFYFLLLITGKEKTSNSLTAIGGLIMGGIGTWVYLSMMVFSREASWGFSIIITPVIQLLCFLAVWALVALTKHSSGTPDGAP